MEAARLIRRTLTALILALALPAFAVDTVRTDLVGGSLLNGFTVPSSKTITFASGSVLSFSGTLSDGVKITFNPNGTNAGINVGAHTADPSSLANGDLWYNSTSNALKARINGATVTLGAGGGGGDVYLASANAFTGANTFTNAATPVVINYTGGLGENLIELKDGGTNKFVVTSAGASGAGSSFTYDNFGYLAFTGASSRTTGTGVLGFDNNALGASSHGALQFGDGTNTTYLVGFESGQTLTDGAVPTYDATNRRFNLTVPAGSGTVTSVALTAPTGMSVSGSPITGSGTLALSYASNRGIVGKGYANGTAVLAATPDYTGQFLSAADYVGIGTGTSAGNVQGLFAFGSSTVYPVGEWQFTGNISQQSGTSQVKSLTISTGNLVVTSGNGTINGNLYAIATGTTGQHELIGSHSSDDAVVIGNTQSTGYAAFRFKYDGDNEGKLAMGVGNSGTPAEFAGKTYIQFFDEGGVDTSPEFVLKQYGKYASAAAQNYDRINIEPAGVLKIRGLTPGTIQGPIAIEVANSGAVTLGGGGGTVTLGSGSGLAQLTAGVMSTTVLRGFLGGFTLSNNGTDASNDLDIAAGQCTDSSNTVMFSGSAMTKQLDATWAAGSAAGGRFSGVSESNSTWYHVFAIRKDSDGSVDYGFDTSITAAHIPAGYTYYRRLGSIYNDGSSVIRPFTQSGDYFEWTAPTLDVDTSTLSTTSTNYALASVPPGLINRVNANIVASHGTAGNAIVYIRNPNATDSTPSASAAPLATIRNSSTTAPAAFIQVTTDTSQQVAARSANSSTTLRIAPLGYFDNRGK